MKSSLQGFYKLDINKRLALIRKFASLSNKELALLKSTALDLKTADTMIENVLGTTQLPVGVATNFLVNGKDYLVPMALEEASVVAASSYAAKLARAEGGFTTTSDLPIMIGQVQIIGLKRGKLKKAAKTILKKRAELIRLANSRESVIIKLGGGLKDVETRIIKTGLGKMLIVHLIIDVKDAMGANIVNTIVETVSPYLEEITGGKTCLRIISNLSVKRMARARAVWKRSDIGGDIIDGILEAYAFASSDPYRCATHNKGVMNGIDAVAIATGNDFRALEAGAHAYAAINKKYSPLTKYEKDERGNLVGSIELPIAVGIVGGATRVHPIAKLSLKILGVKSSQELAEVMASVGLAQNFAALRALVKEGIQRGHMELHAGNIAMMAGAKGQDIENISKEMIMENNISVSRAKQLLDILLHRKKNGKQQKKKNK